MGDMEPVCWCGHPHTNGPACPKYGCSCVLHAPFDAVAVPDELTTLRSELATLRVRDEHYEVLLADNLALREGIRAIANRFNPDPGGSQDTGSPTAADLRALLGDV